MERLLRRRKCLRSQLDAIAQEAEGLLREQELSSEHSSALEKSADELAKTNEALHAEMTDDEVLADMDSVLEYEDRAAGSVGILRQHIEELAVRTTGPSRSNGRKRSIQGVENSGNCTPFLPRRMVCCEAKQDFGTSCATKGIKLTIVLPDDHITAELIATDLHRRLLHAGVATTITELQECFWVTKAKHCVKRVIGQSTWGARLRLKSAVAPMVVLPADRLNVSKPFDVTSIAEGNVAIVREDAVTKFCWKLARVLKKMRGTDGILCVHVD
ncbi:hypothetical protein MTO96_034444 [Rhipicephalus appendiculatus]